MDIKIDLSDRKDIKSTISFTYKKDGITNIIILAFDERPTMNMVTSHISRITNEIRL